MEATQLVIGIEGALAIAAAILGGAFGMWWRLSGEIKSLDTKLSGEIKEVRLASEAAHKEINEKLSAIEITQAIHSERFNTVNERFNKVDEQFKTVNERFNKVDEQFKTVKAQVKSLDDKVDRLREDK